MRIAAHVAAVLLGLAFVLAGMVVLLDMVPEQAPPPEGSAAAHFFAAFGPTGYLKFVKVLEVLGGVLVAVPRTRRAGLLVLGPILVNILAFHVFVMGGAGLADPTLVVLCALALFLVWTERAAFSRFLAARD